MNYIKLIEKLGEAVLLYLIKGDDRQRQDKSL